MKCAPEQEDPRHPTPVMPEEKRQVKQSLEKAIEDVQSPAQAEGVFDDLERVAQGVTEAQAAHGATASPRSPAEAIGEADRRPPGRERTVATLAATAAESVL